MFQKSLRTLAFAATAPLALGVGACVHAQQSLPVVDHVSLSDNTTMLTMHNPDSGAAIGVNLVVATGADTVVVVDSHFNQPFLSGLIRKELDKLAGERKRRYILTTHWHIDHSGGIAHLNDWGDVIAQENTRRHLAEGATGRGLAKPGEPFTIPPQPVQALPEMTFADRMQITDGAFAADIVHYPNGHTDGDAVVYLENNSVVHLGDLIWPGAFPSVDVDNGGNAVALIETLNAVLEKAAPEAKFVTGHGTELLDRTAIEDYIIMLETSIEALRTAKAEGASLVTIDAKAVLSNWSDWASPLVPEDVWAWIVFTSLDQD